MNVSHLFQSTLPARGATKTCRLCIKTVYISIHAPRTGSDADKARARYKERLFQSTLPARGATGFCGVLPTKVCRFQSTLPARGATLTAAEWAEKISISIHAPRTGSDRVIRPAFYASIISIHAPRTGSDEGLTLKAVRKEIFQSTLPARGATGKRKTTVHDDYISIHAPRTGSDTNGVLIATGLYKFQSTLPARGATTRHLYKH